MGLYHEIFGGKLTTNTMDEYDLPQMPVAPEDKDKIMHSYLEGDNDIKIIATDTPSNMEYSEGLSYHYGT
ncbi:MAG: hypothetical protein QM571_04905 [Micrococcaceae bacterium]